MQINLIFAFIMFLILFIVFPVLTMVIFFNNKKVLKIVGIIAFVLYCIMLSILVFGKVNIKNGYVYVNFSNSSTWFSSYFIWADFGKFNILYNLVMLFPVSAFVMSQTNKNVFLKTILISFLVSLTIETLQFVLPIARNTEIFDIVTNVASGIIGYLFFKPIYLLVKKLRQKNIKN